MNAILRKTFLALAAACLVLAATASWVLADGFTAGTISFEPRFGLFGTTNDRVNTIYTYGAGVSYFVIDNVAVELEGLGAYVSQTQNIVPPYGYGTREKDASGIGGNFNLRWHLAATTQASVFLGAGVGGLWFDTKVPYKGSENNVTENAELGATYALTQMLSVKGSLKYMHLGQFNDQSVSAYGGTVGLNLSF
jgi:opacity protein-like surface antigen